MEEGFRKRIESAEPKKAEPPGREVEKKIELDESTIEKIITLLNDRRNWVKELLAREGDEKKLSSDRCEELRYRLFLLDRAIPRLNKGILDEKLLPLLKFPSYRKKRLTELSKTYSLLLKGGLLPKRSEFKKRLQDIKRDVRALTEEEKILVGKLSPREKEER